ncbi:hypothetical protein BDDG_12368 [Blastomyces dermatitidis ATCC 18188]|uniref:Uncharacterized protein n=1 Tax=Ajellomyces dermatitidis (strain ATCC 18188 / CBS 674.68) TaxID=653446 RepID=A0A0J9ENH8_AJEDA|nr:hypothetical protein BDDG_12368 [Blastomyces dermatitidis ATCC 18188]
MADSIRSRPHTRSRSRVLSTGSVAVDDDDSSHSRSASGHPPGAFESSIVETPSQFEAGLNTAPDTVRPAPRSTRQLDEAGSHEFNSSGEAISDQQMEHLKMMLEMDKGKQRVLELELQLEKLYSRVGKAISQFKEDVKNTRNDRPRTLYKEMMNGRHSGTPETSGSTHSSQTPWVQVSDHISPILEFMSLGGTQVINLHTFFDKFQSIITKLEMLNASPSDAWIFDTFYSVLLNNWRNYVQKKIEEIQDSKSTAVVLNVDLLMEEIRSRLDPPKDKKNLQNIDSAANTATTDTMTTTPTNLNNNTSNPARGGRTGRGHGSTQGGS